MNTDFGNGIWNRRKSNLAQGDNTFVDARSLSLKDIVEMVRGAPGSLLQLQVLSADSPPNSPPRTVPIVRDQIKYKR